MTDVMGISRECAASAIGLERGAGGMAAVCLANDVRHDRFAAWRQRRAAK